MHANPFFMKYSDYLNAISQERSILEATKSINYEISSQSLQIIASVKDRERNNIHAISQSAEAITQNITKSVMESSTLIASNLETGFEVIGIRLDDIKQEISELNSNFIWGITQIVSEVRGVNESINELIRLNREPSKTWAYGKYLEAKETFKQKRFATALESIKHAIYGIGSNTGFKNEFRFYNLMGTILLGSSENIDKEVINLGDASKAFIEAYKISSSREEDKSESGRSAFYAGWAFYCQGEFDKAFEYTSLSVKIIPNFGEGHFQMGKILINRNQLQEAMKSLEIAINIDRNYALKAFKTLNREYSANENAVKKLIQSMKNKLKKALNENIDVIHYLLKEFETWGYNEQCPADFEKIKSEIRNINERINEDTYFGHLDLVAVTNEFIPILKNEFYDYKNKLREMLKSRIESARKMVDEIKKSITNSSSEYEKYSPKILRWIKSDLPFYDILNKFEDINSYNDYLTKLSKCSEINSRCYNLERYYENLEHHSELKYNQNKTAFSVFMGFLSFLPGVLLGGAFGAIFCFFLLVLYGLLFVFFEIISLFVGTNIISMNDSTLLTIGIIITSCFAVFGGFVIGDEIYPKDFIQKIFKWKK